MPTADNVVPAPACQEHRLELTAALAGLEVDARRVSSLTRTRPAAGASVLIFTDTAIPLERPGGCGARRRGGLRTDSASTAVAAASAIAARAARPSGRKSPLTATSASTSAARGVGSPRHGHRCPAPRDPPPACRTARAPLRCEDQPVTEHGPAIAATSSGVTKSRPASRAAALEARGDGPAARGLAPSSTLGSARVARTTATTYPASSTETS